MSAMRLTICSGTYARVRTYSSSLGVIILLFLPGRRGPRPLAVRLHFEIYCISVFAKFLKDFQKPQIELETGARS